MKNLILFLALGATVLYLPGCQFFGFGPTPSDSLNLASIASAASEYNDEMLLQTMNSVDKNDFESQSLGTMSLIVDGPTDTVLPNGTVVTITKVLDDADTPEDPIDDVLTVTREFDIWSGETRTEIIERPLPPEETWSGWNVDNLYTQQGTVEVFLDGFLVRSGNIQVTWRLVGSDVSLARLEKEVAGLGISGSVIRTTVEWDENGLETRTQVRVRVTENGEIVVHEFTFEEIEIDGVIYPKIIRDDGRYAIIKSRVDPRITEHYDAVDIMRSRTTATRNIQTGTRTIVLERFDDQGSLIGEPTEITVTYQFLGDTVIITKVIDDREIIIRIEESENGYEISRNGFIYYVVFLGGTIELYDRDMLLLGTVTFNEDGTWTIFYPDLSSEIVTL